MGSIQNTGVPFAFHTVFWGAWTLHKSKTSGSAKNIIPATAKSRHTDNGRLWRYILPINTYVVWLVFAFFKLFELHLNLDMVTVASLSNYSIRSVQQVTIQRRLISVYGIRVRGPVALVGQDKQTEWCTRTWDVSDYEWCWVRVNRKHTSGTSWLLHSGC